MDSKQFILGLGDAHGESYAKLISLMARVQALLGLELATREDARRRAVFRLALHELLSDMGATLYSELQDRAPDTLPSAEQTLRSVDQFIALAERELATDRGMPFTNQ